MKTIVILLSLFVSVSLYAQNPKERIFFSKTKDGTENKAVQQYDDMGRRTLRVFYQKEPNKEWSACHKHEYKYGSNGHLSEIVYTKNDRRKNIWSSKSESLIHLYNSDGKLVATKVVEVDERKLLITQK